MGPMQEFFKTLNDHTRATYYVLPLISLSKFSFGSPENFINAYITPDGKKIVVKVVNTEAIYPEVFLSDYYLTDTVGQIVFVVPTKFLPDVQKFVKGQYSKLSAEAKDEIRLNSSLNYRRERVVNGKKKLDTDARLGALDLDVDLKECLEEMLGITIRKGDELISPPLETEFWTETIN